MPPSPAEIPTSAMHIIPHQVLMHLHPCTGSLQSASRRGRSQIGRGEQLGTVVFPC